MGGRVGGLVGPGVGKGVVRSVLHNAGNGSAAISHACVSIQSEALKRDPTPGAPVSEHRIPLVEVGWRQRQKRQKEEAIKNVLASVVVRGLAQGVISILQAKDQANGGAGDEGEGAKETSSDETVKAVEQRDEKWRI